MGSPMGVPARKIVFSKLEWCLSAAPLSGVIWRAFWEPVAACVASLASLPDNVFTHLLEFIRIVCHNVCVCVCLCSLVCDGHFVYS